MFSTSEVLTVTKGAIAQLIGKGYMDVASGELDYLDDSVIVDLGEKLQLTEDGDFAVNTPADIMFKALLGQIGKVITDNRRYTANLPRLFVDPMNWGIMTEFINIDLSDCMIDEMWNADGYIPWNTPQSGGVYPGIEEGKRIAAIEFGYYKPPISATLYKKAHAIMVALTTAREQLFTAFKGLAEYEAFLAGLYNSVENTLQVKAEIYALMTVSMGIAKSVANSNVINLRTEWIAAGGDNTLTGAALLNDKDFQRYALQRISEVKAYIRRYSGIWNNHSIGTFSPEPNLILLQGFASAAKFGVRANTFNEQLLGVGDFDAVPAWQGAFDGVNTAPYNIESASTISLTDAAATAAGITHDEGDPVAITGIIGVLYDRYAMGITLDKRKPTSQYSASRDTVNTFYHALVNYIVNDNYPIVSFSIEAES